MPVTVEISHRGDPPRDVLILSVTTPAAYHVVAFVQPVQQHADVGGIVLQIGIQQRDGPAARIVDARRNRRRLPEVAPQVDVNHRAGMRLRQLFQPGSAAVAAAVVNVDDLVWNVQCAQRSIQFGLERVKVFQFVVDRDNHG
jgi:hypothetical protein